MLPQLISHSPDLLKLWEKGYDMEIIADQHLLVSNVPYVTSSKEVKYGSLYCVLNLSAPTRTGAATDHTMYFNGELPCDANGNPLMAIINGSSIYNLPGGIVAYHYFSSRPANGYSDYFEKFRTYADILSREARRIDPFVTCTPNKRAA